MTHNHIESESGPEIEELRIGGQRYKRFGGRGITQPAMLRGYVPVDPAAPVFHVGDRLGDLIDVFARFPQAQGGTRGH